MNRRVFLATFLAGSTTVIAGCSSDGGDTPADAGTRTTATDTATSTGARTGTTRTGSRTTTSEQTTAATEPTTEETTPTETETEESTPTETQTPQAGLSVEQSSLVEYEQYGETNLAVDGVIRNTSSRPLSYAQASAQFLDGSDTVIGESLTNLTPLLSGDGWKFRIDYYSEQDQPASDVDSYQLFTDFRRASGEPGSPNLTVTESTLVEKTEFGETTKAVQGTIENTSDSALGYVEANAQFLDANGVIVGSFISNTENLQSDQSWAFEVDYFSETGTPVSEVVDYNLFATE